jgi:hypothetical protein
MAALAGGAIRPAAAQVGAQVGAVAAAPASGPAPGLAAPVVDTAAPYADIADLADSTELVLQFKIRWSAPLEPARATDVRPGWARLYVEGKPLAVLRGPQLLAPHLRYLVDVQMDAKGNVPDLEDQVVLVFARPVAGKPGDIQLVARDGQLPWSAETETRTRAILAELDAPGAPGPVNVVSEAMYVSGTLAGQGETQIFLGMKAGTPAAITVTHTPGQLPHWGVSFSEVVDTGVSGQPPVGTLAWYRLACFLPKTLPEEANVSESPDDRMQAGRDYLLVRTELGDCHRARQ